jgi:hypothetical protein
VPRGQADLLTVGWEGQLRGLIRRLVGGVPWLQGVWPCVVLSVQAGAHTCTVRLRESGDRIERVRYGPTLPQVGQEYAARRTVRLDPARARGLPEEVAWSLKVPGGLALYYRQAHRLEWIPWPPSTPAAEPTLLAEFADRMTAGGYFEPLFLGVAGDGLAYVRVRQTVPSQATAVYRLLSWTVPDGTFVADQAAPLLYQTDPSRLARAPLMPYALDRTPGHGTLLATARVIRTQPGSGRLETDYLYTSTDQGATWQERASVPAARFEILGPGDFRTRRYVNIVPTTQAAHLWTDDADTLQTAISALDLGGREVLLEYTPSPLVLVPLGGGAPAAVPGPDGHDASYQGLLAAGPTADALALWGGWFTAAAWNPPGTPQTWTLYRRTAAPDADWAAVPQPGGPAHWWSSSAAPIRAQDRTATHLVLARGTEADPDGPYYYSVDGGTEWTAMATDQTGRFAYGAIVETA